MPSRRFVVKNEATLISCARVTRCTPPLTLISPQARRRPTLIFRRPKKLGKKLPSGDRPKVGGVRKTRKKSTKRLQGVGFRYHSGAPFRIRFFAPCSRVACPALLRKKRWIRVLAVAAPRKFTVGGPPSSSKNVVLCEGEPCPPPRAPPSGTARR